MDLIYKDLRKEWLSHYFLSSLLDKESGSDNQFYFGKN